MQDLSLIEKNIISPYNEMLAYETLWAIKDIKEKKLKEFFKSHTPSETLKEISSQPDFFSLKKSPDTIKNKVNIFLDNSLKNEFKRFSIVVNKSFQYPESLNKATLPIGLFYYKGHLDILQTECISIVGTRKPSENGIKTAKELSKELVSKKFTIVSGLAKGIDTIAHQSVIDNNGKTIGVIGTPINKYYPEENKNLQDEIANKFLIISQVPFYKYANEPFNHRRFHFPRRNKIMASISKATIVVEASDTSGSLIQARECLRQGKKLFIWDSCFKNPKSKWAFNLEKRGAIRVSNPKDVLDSI